MNRYFTGRHMATITVGFFAVVIVVNLVMATFAARTFSGTVVDNSYIASQKFNGWLAEAQAQRRTGWGAMLSRQGDRADLLLTGVEGARIDALAQHPLGLSPDIRLRFEPMGGGHYRSVGTLPAGRWLVRIDVRHGADVAHFLQELPA